MKTQITPGSFNIPVTQILISQYLGDSTCSVLTSEESKQITKLNKTQWEMLSKFSSQIFI